MDITFKGRHTTVPERFRRHAAAKLAKLEKLDAKATRTGNPVRPAVIEAAKVLYVAPGRPGPLNLLVFGGSQGARIMADIVPPAIELQIGRAHV